MISSAAVVARPRETVDTASARADSNVGSRSTSRRSAMTHDPIACPSDGPDAAANNVGSQVRPSLPPLSDATVSQAKAFRARFRGMDRDGALHHLRQCSGSRLHGCARMAFGVRALVNRYTMCRGCGFSRSPSVRSTSTSSRASSPCRYRQRNGVYMTEFARTSQSRRMRYPVSHMSITRHCANHRDFAAIILELAT